MSNFEQLPEFARELKKLSKKYRSLEKDLRDFEAVISVMPTGAGKNFTIIHVQEDVKIVKARLACKTLRDRSMRIIYAYHDATITFVHIEIYFKGNKENEDRGRIENYLKNL
ncbi:MAG: hypothetical protein A3C02_00805 [Candidatus Andersenbacteria bacterium RIFCSPHIGHO2_02_FULL_45_11]|uniref:Uncharacterized protein n=1 Tax=Candidatus Andersenbacteria bacterium RIFCSPHIGHO2_12_FULL_45_11 TaxID=1797281 RepID=A0A1G1X3U8_9BACT|nr:MAG: hypothetical protein A2805_01620 [Candidatus Andersenbacteria bacterium RIFCSPHIGHO2_01_FULL_46_36]OGY33324.1 MAG: hypothetical protein A3C02_00805 [Candidatus Andersenbacteria bacterium RIFCSPHIGHO2_02_FULL_45_11]OGY34678.1 MAG: hypothetical protein A3D99_05050 [Candidatus Andersenbacteria bacterium RIFCSPHIGHO2_12_FULL_45_11]